MYDGDWRISLRVSVDSHHYLLYSFYKFECFAYGMAMADTTNSRIIASATVTGRQSVFVRNDSIIKMARVAIGQLSHIQSKLDLFTSRIIDVFAVQSHSGPNMEQ